MSTTYYDREIARTKSNLARARNTQAFLQDYYALCQKHNLMIEHYPHDNEDYTADLSTAAAGDKLLDYKRTAALNSSAEEVADLEKALLRSEKDRAAELAGDDDDEDQEPCDA